MGEVSVADGFGQAIMRTMMRHGFRSALEIGSHDGTGSTQLLIASLAVVDSPRLVCLEPDAARYEQLCRNVAAHPWVETKQMASISAASLTPSNFTRDVWESPFNRLRYPREQVAEWWSDTRSFYSTSGPGYLEGSSDTFDAILIDGDEFSGHDDFRLAKGRCRCLMLDDVHHAYKCNRAHADLWGDSNWTLVWADAFVRNGASIWIRK